MRERQVLGPGAPADPGGEQGSALILALILTIILTFLGFGLLTRSLLVTRIAGAERFSTKAFYAADSGIQASVPRLGVEQRGAFSYQLADLRGPLGDENRGQVNIDVTPWDFVGRMPAEGSQLGGGQDSPTPSFYYFFYRGTSTARQLFTRSERVVSATLKIKRPE